MMKVLYARTDNGIYAVRVHLDTTKLLPDGVTPDPAWVREWDWSTTPPPGQTAQTWQAQVQAETKLLAQAAYAQLAAPANVTGFEGSTF